MLDTLFNIRDDKESDTTKSHIVNNRQSDIELYCLSGSFNAGVIKILSNKTNPLYNRNPDDDVINDDNDYVDNTPIPTITHMGADVETSIFYSMKSCNKAPKNNPIK